MSYLDKELAPLRIPHEDIVIATKNFAEENLLKRGRKADVYKGVLFLWSKLAINVVIRRYTTYPFEFYEEIKRISRFKHRNAVSFIGFCDENDENMIVMEHIVNGSLDKYLSDPTTLTWSQRLHICYGAALALKNIDGTIRSFKILLDKDWEAKLAIYFEFLEIHVQSFPPVTVTVVYTLGMILLEVLYGRKATIKDVNQYQAKMAKNHNYEEGKQVLQDIIAPNLRTQMHPQSLYIFSITTYNCLKKHPWQPPDMYQIVNSLKEAFDIQWKHENLLWVENFASLNIPLRQIKLATDDFADAYRINIYHDVYKAKLNHFDKEENKGEVPKKTVVIKRNNKYNKTTKDFFAEIEMLTSCKHPNLLSFLGFCDEESEMILVSECDFKENLQYYLSRVNRPSPTWEQRIQICIDIARGLNYLHNMEGKQSMLHHILQSTHVFLDEKLTVKIANYNIYGFDLDATSLWQSRPENFRTWLLGHRFVVDDIYSFGVILFEILTGRLAYDLFYMEDKINRLAFASMGQRHFDEGKLKSMADPRIVEEAQYSLDAFSEITYQCLTLQTDQSERPTFEVVIKSLEKALHVQHVLFQVQKLGHAQIPLEDIKLATKCFDINYLIGSGGYGEVYKAELKMKSKDEHPHTLNNVAIKRIISRKDSQGIEGFLGELDVVSKCKHPNVISLLGFCVEHGEMLLVYEFASNGSLDDYLQSIDTFINLTWTQRIKLCIAIAQGLKYMHTIMEDKNIIIHRDIKSANILLGKNWEAKIADFGLSKVHHHEDQGISTINTKTLAGTEFYLDPEYARTGRLKTASDIYSLGVVLFEIFSGKLAYDSKYVTKNEKGLAPIARRHFKKGKLKYLLDPKIMGEAQELGFTGIVEPDHDSFDVFSRIAYQCVAKTQVKRPTINAVIEELEKALHFEESRIITFKISLENIRVGVENFSDDNCIMREGYGMLYKGKIQYNNRQKRVVVKRFSHDRYLNDTSSSWEHCFLREFEVLFKYRHENIIGLVGYCREIDERIIVYEYASKGCLHSYFNDTSFSWTKRVKICIDIANGLRFLHGGNVGQDMVIHRDIKSSNILLNNDWKAKICGFEHAVRYPTNEGTEYVIDNFEGSLGYSDPLFLEARFLTKESDIYSFGVILFELLCGRFACPEDFRDRSQFLDVLVKRHFQEVPVEGIVFEGIKEQVGLNSLATFQSIAFQCLLNNRQERPTAGDVALQLRKALEFQEAYERRETKWDRNNEILGFSNSRESYSARAKKDIYNIISKGILLEHDKLEIIRTLKHTTFYHEEDDDYI